MEKSVLYDVTIGSGIRLQAGGLKTLMPGHLRIT